MRLPKTAEASTNRPVFSGKTILVGVTGSIACYKSVYLVRRLMEAGADVHVAMSESASRFVTPLTFEAVSGNPVMTDLFAGQPNRHIHLAEKADIAVVAPATADLLARHAAGRADDALSTLLIALRGPLLVAPAMDGGMWEHPATRANVDTLKSRGVQFVEPERGYLASGLSGVGRMAEPDDIVAALAGRIAAGLPLAGEHLLVTAGPTREHLDPVRFLSNPSTGRMGFAVARQAAKQGASVTLIAGPVDLATPEGCERVDVISAKQMKEAVYGRLPHATVLVMAAAVSDFAPRIAHAHKVKKAGGESEVELVRTADILAGTIGRGEPGLIRVGFAAETRDLTRHAREKLVKKQLDLIVANDVTEKGAGFAADTNKVVLIDREGSETALPVQSKSEVADAILARVRALRESAPKMRSQSA